MLDDRLFGKTRAAILRELYSSPHRRISFNELVRRVQSGDGAVSRELKKLLDAGLIEEERESNLRLLRAAKRSPVYAALKEFITKASGAPWIVREALLDLEHDIEVACVIGSVARGQERPDSDLDLVVIGQAGYSRVSDYLRAAEKRLGRRFQTLYFSTDSPLDRASLRKPSVQSLLSGPKRFVIGNEDGLRRILRARR
ncbi:MAG: MarR family transcriptional regulator [Gammaproteobacteria bacterium]|nr:MarR family transcriptional regulator [Gammaproteobacteria bacterium]